MIPKIIHLCWLSGDPYPRKIQLCIDTWKKYCPDYEIILWDTKRFDVNSTPWTKQAFEAKKYAFVSDYARFWILYHYGGIYFDTDVEVIKPIDDIVDKGPFMGVEVYPCKIIPEDLIGYPMVAPGLGIGAPAGLPFYRLLLDYYAGMHFLRDDGSIITGTVVAHTTRLLVQEGLHKTGEIQHIAGMWIYPEDYFNPFDDLTGRLKITENTRSIHWYARTWQKRHSYVQWLSRMVHRVVGNRIYRLRKALFGVE